MSAAIIFNAAIEAHVQWKNTLRKHVDGMEQQDVAVIANGHACDLGKWIYGDGARFNHLPSFEEMCMAHEQFHRAAAEIVLHSNKGDIQQAKALFSPDGRCCQSSVRLVKSIMDCSRELSLHLEKGEKPHVQVRDILKTKNGEKIVSIEATAPVREAIHTMVGQGIGALVVRAKDQDGEIAGILTERSLLKGLARKGTDILDLPIIEAIDQDTVHIHPEDSVERCMVLMTCMHTHYLPVMADGGELVGIISIGDVVKKVSDTDNDKISMLESYIHGNYGTS